MTDAEKEVARKELDSCEFAIRDSVHWHCVEWYRRHDEDYTDSDIEILHQYFASMGLISKHEPKGFFDSQRKVWVHEGAGSWTIALRPSTEPISQFFSNWLSSLYLNQHVERAFSFKIWDTTDSLTSLACSEKFWELAGYQDPFVTAQKTLLEKGIIMQIRRYQGDAFYELIYHTEKKS